MSSTHLRLAVAASLLAVVSACGGSGGGSADVGIVGPYSPGVAYLADAEVDEVVELYTASLDGTAYAKVSAALGASAEIDLFEWSPDRARLSYVVRTPIVPTAIHVADPTGAQAAVVVAQAPANGEIIYVGWSPSSQRIAYLLLPDRAIPFEDQSWELWTVLATGGGAVRLSNPPLVGRSVFEAQWSLDSTRLAFLSDEDVAGVVQLHTALATGGGRTTLPGPIATEPIGVALGYRWSPDSQRIAYVADMDGDFDVQIHVAMFDGTGGLSLWPAAVPEPVRIELAWAPNGSRLAFTAGDGFSLGTLFTAPPTGPAVSVSEDALGDHLALEFQWSPDSSQLAFVGFTLDPLTFPGEGGLLVVGATGGPLEVLGPSLTGPTITWAPDSSRVAWQIDGAFVGATKIFTAEPGAGALEVELSMGTGGTTIFRWSPDSSRIAWSGTEPTLLIPHVWVALATTTWGRLEVSPAPLYDPIGLDVAWTPDAEWVVYVAQVSGFGVSELFASRRDGSETILLSGPLVVDGAVRAFAMR